MGVFDELDVTVNKAAVGTVLVVSPRRIFHIFEDPTGCLLVVIGFAEINGGWRIFNAAESHGVGIFLLGG